MARRATRSLLEDANWSAERIEDACLVISELVTNAVRHGGGVGRVCLDIGREQLCIEVDDHNDEPLRRRLPPSTARNGRGLWIIDELCDAWGSTIVEDAAVGKRVWATLKARAAGS